MDCAEQIVGGYRSGDDVAAFLPWSRQERVRPRLPGEVLVLLRCQGSGWTGRVPATRASYGGGSQWAPVTEIMSEHLGDEVPCWKTERGGGGAKRLGSAYRFKGWADVGVNDRFVIPFLLRHRLPPLIALSIRARNNRMPPPPRTLLRKGAYCGSACFSYSSTDVFVVSY